jgi:hypothetical protein
MQRALIVCFLGALVAVLLLGLPRSVSARERVVVHVSAEGDTTLGENLSEVIIAKLAETGDYELVGTGELRASASDIQTVREVGLDACLELPACLSEVGARAQAVRALLGRVRRAGSEYAVDLRLVRADTFRTEAQELERAPAELGSLIAAVQRGAGALVETTTRAPSAPSSPPAARALPDVPQTSAPASAGPPSPREAPKAAYSSVSTSTGPQPARGADSAWTTYAGFAAAGLAVIAFSTAAITGGIATAPPEGDTRAERQKDIERRESYASTANAAFVAGGVLTAGSVVLFAWP